MRSFSKPAQRVLDGIKCDGYEKWFQDMAALYACPSCGILNSAYEPKCRKCGATPSCEYVNRHRDAISAHLTKM